MQCHIFYNVQAILFVLNMGDFHIVKLQSELFLYFRFYRSNKTQNNNKKTTKKAKKQKETNTQHSTTTNSFEKQGKKANVESLFVQHKAIQKSKQKIKNVIVHKKKHPKKKQKGQ